MKRTPELTPLSHDHHQALFLAHRLRRAEEPNDANTALLRFWRTHGRRHFEIEEGILLPAWFALDAGADHVMAARVSAEHLTIRAFVRRAGSKGVELIELQKAGELLAAHVRFEERELFPLIEERLDAEALAELGRELAVAERRDTAGVDEGPPGEAEPGGDRRR